MKTVYDAFEELQQLPSDTPICMVLWEKKDVIHIAETRKLEVSDKLATEVLDSLTKNYDAAEGISWRTIENELDKRLRLEGLNKS